MSTSANTCPENSSNSSTKDTKKSSLDGGLVPIAGS